MELLSVFVSISRAIGLCNLRYVAERKRFELDHGLMLVYWLLLNVVYVVLTPVCFVLMVNSYYSCQGMDMLSMAYSCVSLTKSCSLFVVLGSVWLRRQRIRRVCNGYMRLLERFAQYHANYSYWRRHLWKLLLSNTRFVVLLNQLFGPGSALMCGVDDDEVVTGLPPIYVGLSVAVLLMDLLASCTDSLAYCVLEFAIIYLNRRLQLQPRKSRNLQIMGLFDMNRGFWNSMNASIGMNVLILWQLAYKNYY